MVVNSVSCAESFGIAGTCMDVTSRRVEKVLATYNGVHAKGLINYGHSVVELWYVLVGLYRVRTAN